VLRGSAKLPEEGVDGVIAVVGAMLLLLHLLVVDHLDVELLQVELQDLLHLPSLPLRDPVPVRHQAAGAGDEDTLRKRETGGFFFGLVSLAFYWAA
jgi:hypothetical protein